MRMFSEERQDVQVGGGESLRVKTWKDMDQPNGLTFENKFISTTFDAHIFEFEVNFRICIT